MVICFFFSSRRRHTRLQGDWSSDVCSSDLPIQVGFIDDEEWKKIQRRPIIAPEDVGYVGRALPDAQAISLQSGWPTPMADVQWRNRTVGDVLIFGVTPPLVVVQDYSFAAGVPFADVDNAHRMRLDVHGV